MEAMLKVPKGQDPYNVIGQYIQNHIAAIEDIIATIELDGMRTNELFMVDMQKDGYFVWKDDWWEGEEDVALLDFFPVSDAVPERKTQPDRDIPKKPNETTDRSWGIPHRQAVCPNCDCYLVDVYFIDGSKRKVTYCSSCGQAIDWEGWKGDLNV